MSLVFLPDIAYYVVHALRRLVTAPWRAHGIPWSMIFPPLFRFPRSVVEDAKLKLAELEGHLGGGANNDAAAGAGAGALLPRRAVCGWFFVVVVGGGGTTIK